MPSYALVLCVFVHTVLFCVATRSALCGQTKGRRQDLLYATTPQTSDIIADAHKARYTVADDDAKKQGIVISEAWLAELEKHPFHSSKC